MEDISDRVPAENAQSSQEDRASHLSFVAHEIRNPLSTALWSAELLARLSAEDRAGPRGEKLARLSLRALGRLRRIVEDHLLQARLEAGGMAVESEALPATDLIPDAAAIDAASIEARIDPDLVVVTDPSLARRVMEGVLLAASSEGAAVRVVASRVGSMARFRIEGAPPAPGALDDPRRGHPGDSRGAALSLGVARRAVPLIGGSLRLDGGAWVVELPAALPTGPRRQDGA